MKRPPDSSPYLDGLGFASDVECAAAHLFALDLDARSQAYGHPVQPPRVSRAPWPPRKHVPYQSQKYLMLSGISLVRSWHGAEIVTGTLSHQ